jgi:hypothetical protein
MNVGSSFITMVLLISNIKRPDYFRPFVFRQIRGASCPALDISCSNLLTVN